MKQKNLKGLISEYFIFLIFIVLVVALTILKPSFISRTTSSTSSSRLPSTAFWRSA